MGFKCLHDYNVAMLGKQGWRLLTRPNSLVAKVYRARYYPHDTFLEAKIGHNPSFTWRSLLTAQDDIKKGVGRRVGRGDQTNVWWHPWLMDTINPYVVATPPPQLADMKVAELIKADRGVWDEDLVKEIVTERDVEIIMRMPIAETTIDDEWYWREDASGIYSVRSVYRSRQNARPQQFTNTAFT